MLYFCFQVGLFLAGPLGAVQDGVADLLSGRAAAVNNVYLIISTYPLNQ